jgi:hypothetical protein
MTSTHGSPRPIAAQVSAVNLSFVARIRRAPSPGSWLRSQIRFDAVRRER